MFNFFICGFVFVVAISSNLAPNLYADDINHKTINDQNIHTHTNFEYFFVAVLE